MRKDSILQNYYYSQLPKAEDGKEYTGSSIVDYLATKGYSGKKAFRKELAEQYGIENYDFSAAKNLELLSKIKENEEVLKKIQPSYAPIPVEKMMQMEKEAAIPKYTSLPNKTSEKGIKRNENFFLNLMMSSPYRDLPPINFGFKTKLKRDPVAFRSNIQPDRVTENKTQQLTEKSPLDFQGRHKKGNYLANFKPKPQVVAMNNGVRVPYSLPTEQTGLKFPLFPGTPSKVSPAVDNGFRAPYNPPSESTQSLPFPLFPQFGSTSGSTSNAAVPSYPEIPPYIDILKADYQEFKNAGKKIYNFGKEKAEDLYEFGKDKLNDLYDFGKNKGEEFLENVEGYWNLAKRAAQKYMPESEETIKEIDEGTILNDKNTKKNKTNKSDVTTVKTPTKVEEIIPVEFGYKELYTVPDVGGKKGNELVAFSNTFDNDEGAKYYIGHKAKEVTSAGAKKHFTNAYAVAHFLRDSDILPGQKITPSTWNTLKGYEYHTTSPGKTVSAINFNNPDWYRTLYKRDPSKKDPDAYLVKYVRNKDITPETEKKLKNEGWSLDFTVSGQHKFSDVDWDGKGEAAYGVSKWVPLKGGGHTGMVYKDKKSFSRFSGGSVTYLFKHPQTGKSIGVDISGSIDAIRKAGEAIAKKYKINLNDLQFIYHDMGSYSAKPKAKPDGSLDYDQWLDYNTYNKGFSGAPLIIPKNKYGGLVKAQDGLPFEGAIFNALHKKGDYPEERQAVINQLANLPIYSPDVRYASYQEALPIWRTNVENVPIEVNPNSPAGGSAYYGYGAPAFDIRFPYQGTVQLDPRQGDLVNTGQRIAQHELRHAAFDGRNFIPRWYGDALYSTARRPEQFDQGEHQNLLNERASMALGARQAIIDRFGLKPNVKIPRELFDRYNREILETSLRQGRPIEQFSDVDETLRGARNATDAYNIINFELPRKQKGGWLDRKYGPGGQTTDGCGPGYSKHPLTGDCLPNGWTPSGYTVLAGVTNQSKPSTFTPSYKPSSESVGTGVTSLQRKPEVERKIDVTKKIAKQPVIKQGRKSTPAEEAERKRKNIIYASQQPNAQIDKQGNVSRVNPNRSVTGKAENFMSRREDKAAEHALTALEVAGYLEGAGALGSLARKAAIESTKTGLLSNVHRINPFAGTFAGESKLPSWLQLNKLDDANAYWRLTKDPEKYGIYEGAYFNKGVPLTGDLANTFEKGSRPWMHRYSGLMYNPETGQMNRYFGPDYLFKVTDPSKMEPFLKFPEPHLRFFRSTEAMSPNSPGVTQFKKDWLRGWKEVPKPTNLDDQLKIIQGDYLESELPKNYILQSDINEFFNRQKEWIQSDEYFKRRSAATGETADQIKKDVDDILNKWKDVKILSEKNDRLINANAAGMYDELDNVVALNPELSRRDALSALDHEIKHAISQIATTKNYKNYPKANIGNPLLEFFNLNSDFSYLSQPWEQQVRALRLLDFMEKKYGIPRGTQLSIDDVNKLHDDIQIGGKYGKEFVNDYDDLVPYLNRMIIEDRKLKFTPNDLLKGKNPFKSEKQGNFTKNLLNQLNRAYAIPAGVITAGSILSSNEQKKKGGVVKDNNGYWNPDNWGKVVEIDSPNITMQGVYEPLEGISKQTGERKMMLPGKDYTFANTKQVIEKPLNKKSTGGWLDKYN